MKAVCGPGVLLAVFCLAANARVAAVLPDPGGELAPALTRAQDGVSGALLADLSTCASCHPQQAKEWLQSAHAASSFDNPWYRASADSFRVEAGRDASRMCGGCHDLALLVDDAMDQPISADDPRALAGVPCLACHGSAARPDGNGSLTLMVPVLPEDGGADSHNAGALQRHVDAMSTGLRDPTLCTACHRAFLSSATGHQAQLVGMDEGGAWAASAWAGSRASVLEPPVVPADCVDCHMASGHRFSGAQTALAQQLGPQALDADNDLLDQAAQVSLGAVWVAGQPVLAQDLVLRDAAGTLAAGSIELGLVVRNVGVGHAFPAGLKDTQDLQLVAELLDRRGDVLQITPPWSLGAVVVDAQGQPERSHRPQRFVAVIADSSVPARGARAVRVRVALPRAGDLAGSDLAGVRIQLIHRRHSSALADAACDAADPAWTQARQALDRPVLDACLPQPVRVIAQTMVSLGPDKLGPDELDQPELDTWSAPFALALAMTDDRTDGLQDAAAVVALLRPQTRFQQAQQLWLQARIAARQDRVSDVLDLVAQAQDLIGPHPALDRVVGDALARGWQWADAQLAYGAVAASSPRDTGAWIDLAVAAAGAGDPDAALAAARRGLQSAPRDPTLLRVQAFALRDLGQPDEGATQAWLSARSDDRWDPLAARCAREVAGCADWQRPVPVLGAGAGVGAGADGG